MSDISTLIAIKYNQISYLCFSRKTCRFRVNCDRSIGLVSGILMIRMPRLYPQSTTDEDDVEYTKLNRYTAPNGKLLLRSYPKVLPDTI